MSDLDLEGSYLHDRDFNNCTITVFDLQHLDKRKRCRIRRDYRTGSSWFEDRDSSACYLMFMTVPEGGGVYAGLPSPSFQSDSTWSIDRATSQIATSSKLFDQVRPEL